MKYLIVIISLLFMACQSNPDPIKKASSSPSSDDIIYKDLDVETFKRSIKCDDCVIIDVRTPEEIAEGKIENALEIDYYDKDFASKINALDKDGEYYLYCKAGSRSSKAAQMMSEGGFKNVYNLIGGYTAWKKI